MHSHEPPIAVSMARFRKTYTNAGAKISDRWMPMGPAGFTIGAMMPDGRSAFIIVSQAEIEGDEWIHASISYPDENPSYDDLALLKKAVFGPQRTAYQVFPTESQHVNFYEHALHIWGLVNGRDLLPRFGQYGMI